MKIVVVGSVGKTVESLCSDDEGAGGMEMRAVSGIVLLYYSRQ